MITRPLNWSIKISSRRSSRDSRIAEPGPQEYINIRKGRINIKRRTVSYVKKQKVNIAFKCQEFGAYL